MGRELDIPEVTGATVLRIRPGDVLVLMCREAVSGAQHAAIRERVRELWPELPVLVLENTDVAVLRRAEQDDDHDE